jgi:hypothetical protein
MKKKNDNVINISKVKNNLPIKQETINPVNEKCKEIVRNQIIPLFESKELNKSNYHLLYVLTFYLSQELAYMHMPVDQIKTSFDRGSNEAIQYYLDRIAKKYSLVGQIEEEDKPRTIN